MILTRELAKSFGSRRVLRGLDLAVDPAAITLLVGANGAGKTTTMRLLAGLTHADSGTIAIEGHDLRKSRSAALERLAFLPQAPRFHPRLTTLQTAEFYSQLRGRSRRDAEAALDRWGMLEHAEVPTGKLSGGLRQRLALAVFSVTDASVLLLDEPGLSLDPEWRASLQEYLVDAAARGCTVLVATHLLGEWEGRADRCLLVEHGRSQGELPPDELRRAFPRLAPEVAAGSAEGLQNFEPARKSRAEGVRPVSG